MKVSRLLWALFGLMSSAAAVRAEQVIFSNAVPTFKQGVAISSVYTAEDFRLPADSIVTGVRFWTIEGPVDFDNHIDYRILIADGAHPGSVAEIGEASNIARTYLGNQGGTSRNAFQYQYEFDLARPFLAQADTTFFFAIHVLDQFPTPFNDKIYWSIAEQPRRDLSSHYLLTGQWRDLSTRVEDQFGGSHLAFQLIGEAVPEPPGHVIALLALAFPLLLKRFRRL